MYKVQHPIDNRQSFIIFELVSELDFTVFGTNKI